jgi:hypothetical protein
MTKFLKISGIALIGTLLLSGGFVGCTKKPSAEESSKLDEAKAAAESAERKLSDLRMERMKLEQELGGTQSQEQGEKQELDNLENPPE